jgi:hypothetical protein
MFVLANCSILWWASKERCGELKSAVVGTEAHHSAFSQPPQRIFLFTTGRIKRLVLIA